MGLFDFWKKNVTAPIDENGVAQYGDADASSQTRITLTPVDWSDFINAKVADANFLELFRSIPEVFFPIDFIASRIAGAKFVLRDYKTDAIKWRHKEFAQLTSQPNCLQCWNEFVYQFFVQKLATGNAFVRAAMADTFKDADKFRWCSNYWVIPTDHVETELKHGGMPVFGIAEKEDFIERYRVSGWNGGQLYVPTWQVWHDRDGAISFDNIGGNFLNAKSRLASQMKPISNLLAVYEARNIIYVKRGAIGFIVNKSSDETGNVAMQPDEVKDLLEQNFEGKYGLSSYQYPYGFSNQPIDFVRTNLSISDLEPFEETLLDAVTIAAAYGIPNVLVPRKDQSKFSNLSVAEKGVYTGTIIPMAKTFCNDLTHFLGYDKAGLYIDCDFSDVACLQEGLLDAENVKEKQNNRCMLQFNNGLITLNDWRGQIGEEVREDIELFGKLKYEMTDEELAIISKITGGTGQQPSAGSQMNNNQNQNQEDDGTDS